VQARNSQGAKLFCQRLHKGRGIGVAGAGSGGAKGASENVRAEEQGQMSVK
jgi:hypothetical protein